MALHFSLMINGRSIYYAMDIQRLDDNPADPDPDAVFRYRARAVSEDGSNPAHQLNAIVEHRYGDGAWELIRKALNAMLEPAGESG